MCQVNPGNSPVSFHITTDICLHRQLAPWSPQAVSCRGGDAPMEGQSGKCLAFLSGPARARGPCGQCAEGGVGEPVVCRLWARRSLQGAG